MIRYIVLTACMSFAATGLAEDRGKVRIVGLGSAESVPEYAQVDIVVTSLCFETSTEAKEANAALAQQLLAALKEFSLDPRDTITASGGPSVRQTETIYLGNNKSKILCEEKWRTYNILSLKMAAIDKLSLMQDRLLLLIDEAGAIDANKTAQTYAEMSQPSFYVYPETLRALRNEAQKGALDDAKLQFDVFAGHCGFSDVRLSTIAPAEYSTIYQTDDLESKAGPTPIIPDLIKVKASWQIEWTFGAAASCFMF